MKTDLNETRAKQSEKIMYKNQKQGRKLKYIKICKLYSNQNIFC